MSDFSPHYHSGRHVWVALGSNQTGHWGSPEETLRTAVDTLNQLGHYVQISSDLYQTLAVGLGRQAIYLNAAILLRSNVAPATLLRVFKRLERAAGRRLGRHWGPRPLDIDIISTRLAIGGTGRRRVAGQLVLPHPEMQNRAFVLAPLADIAPHWWHPKLGCTIHQLMRRPLIKRQMRGLRRCKGSSIRLLPY